MLHRLVPLLLAVAATSLGAADYQFSATVPGGDARHVKKGWLWIPPTCTRIRGLIFARQVILEQVVTDDPQIRKAATELGLGVVLTRHFDSTFTYNQPGVPADLQSLLANLAAESGYPEIATAPLLPIGHSGAAIMVWNMGYWQPKRTFGMVTLHACAIAPPAWDSKAQVDHIPVLAVNGEWEMWGDPTLPLDHHIRWLRGGLLEMRGRRPDTLASALIQPGAGHFNWDDRLAAHVADFIRAAADQRLPPAEAPAGTPLRDVPLSDGWLGEATQAAPSRIPPAPAAAYTGDPSLAYWYPNGDLARRAEAYAVLNHGKKPQMLSFVEEGSILPAQWIVGLKPLVGADGETVQVKAAFIDRWPEKLMGAGAPLGHAPRGAISYRLFGGWGGGGEQTGPDTFRLKYSVFGAGGGVSSLMVLASHPGDHEYGYTEMAASINFPDRWKEGTPQTISFPQPADVAKGTAAIDLAATATSGLPVSYAVISGPAVVTGNHLVFTPLPTRAKLPVTITLQAYQRGRPGSPAVQTADPVERSFTYAGP